MAHSIEILDFARKNSLIASNLDAIMEALKDAPLYECMQKDMHFCKYAFIEAKKIGYEGLSTVARISKNKGHLRCGYETRVNEAANELPYLTKWLDKEHVTPEPVTCIAVILYSREQLEKEGIKIDADFGIVTAQAEPMMNISPMTPHTIMRNAMGPEYGGNGTPIDREYYLKSVNFWSEWAIVK